MRPKKWLKNYLKNVLKHHGYEIQKSSSSYEWQKLAKESPVYNESKLPKGSENYFQYNNPRLKELKERYALFDGNVITPLLWTENHVSPDDIKYFRGDNAYVWQLRGKSMNIFGYVLSTYYVKSIDYLGLLEKLTEDPYFGNIYFHIDNKIISRDLLDSIIEIYFLEKHLSISSINDLNILDIGAGYGRLAHRMITALPNIRSYLCTDAFAYSTFISEYYIRYRNLEDKAKVVPLDEIEKVLTAEKIDIAINIHSFSECKTAAIEWWLSLLEKNKIKYLMIVPNEMPGIENVLLTNDNINFQEIIERHGYKLITKAPKYSDSTVQEYAINPTYYYLFEFEKASSRLITE
ncbi:MAG: putative sugar O-methyltransferase [Bacteroidota bacterium]|nr:putative sugar O-methyltransferase [Bacteroidota bacterium]